MTALAIGGETPILEYGLEISAETPSGTSVTTPVLEGDLFELDGSADSYGNGYKLVACTAGDKPSTVILAYALVRSQNVEAIGVKILTGQATQIRRLGYNGAAPTVGNSVAIAAGNVRRGTGIAFARGDGLVLAVDTSTSEVEVLI